MRTITIKHIRRTLFYLKKNFDTAMSSTKIEDSFHAALYSKLAVLELSGWIEETIDNILIGYVKRKVINKKLQESIKEEIIGKVYGFKYSSDYRPLMERILGVKQFNKVNSALVRKKQYETFHNKLSELAKQRDRVAHTFFRDGVTLSCQDPSITINNFNILYDALKIVNDAVCKLK